MTTRLKWLSLGIIIGYTGQYLLRALMTQWALGR